MVNIMSNSYDLSKLFQALSYVGYGPRMKGNLRGGKSTAKKTLPWNRYNQRRRATLRKRPRGAPARVLGTKSYGTFKKRGSRAAAFGSKGIVVFQKNKYLLDHTATRDGYQSGTAYFPAYYNLGFDSGVHTPFPVPLGTPGTTPSSHVYGRLQSPLSQHISTSNMATQFGKVKVAYISHTFHFPDQAAATTNDKWPLVIWVNHGDKWRVNIDTQGDTSEFTSVEDLLERPGWKKYVVKRMNKLTITYAPTMLKTIEQNVAGTGFDAKKLVKVPWLDINNSTNMSTQLCGPTVCFQLPDTFIPASGTSSQYYENAFSSTASSGNNMSTFLEYTTVTVSAKVMFKDPDTDAVRGC